MELFHEYREQWLDAAIQSIRPRFKASGYTLPDNIKVSCGWPVGSRGAKKVLGQCFAPQASSNGSIEIFISPTLDKPGMVLGVLVHELVHAAVGNEAGHGKAFQKACAAIGLTGKATAALPGPELAGWLTDNTMPYLGEYPHASVDFNQRKKQGTRMIKLVCPETGYTVRTTKKWIEQGLPISPAGFTMVPVEDEIEE